MNIKQLRESKNMTQENIARFLGVKRTTIAMWESGQSLPRAQLLPKLAELFGCTVDELLGIEKTPTHNGQA